MKRPFVILALGVFACVMAFGIVYFAGTTSSRELLREPQPELAWLKKEFNLGEGEFARIVELHEAYLPQCAERCRAIEKVKAKLEGLVADASAVTPEIHALMVQRAKMRADCEAEMLKHFIEVSRTMPPEQGRRYLGWVERQTVLRGEAMEQRHHVDHGSHAH